MDRGCCGVQHSPQEVTQILHAWCSGDKAALDRLVPLIHDELHRLAHRYMRRERVGHTVQATALVNEAYVTSMHRPPNPLLSYLTVVSLDQAGEAVAGQEVMSVIHASVRGLCPTGECMSENFGIRSLVR